MSWLLKNRVFLATLLGTLVTAVAFTGLTKVAFAQDPSKLAPENYKILLDNCQIRVMDYHLRAGEKEPMHSHPAGVFAYYLTGGKVRTTTPDGKIVEASSRSGDGVWREPVTHGNENIGDTEVRALVIEPKNVCK